MLHTFIAAIRELGSVSEFETYCGNLQRTGLVGAPTADEARKDYRAFQQSRTQTLTV